MENIIWDIMNQSFYLKIIEFGCKVILKILEKNFPREVDIYKGSNSHILNR